MNIREFFWPILEPGDEAEEARILQMDLDRIQTAPVPVEADLLIEEARRLLDAESDRRKSAEARANTYLAIAGVLIPLVAAAMPSALQRPADAAMTTVSLGLVLLAGAYLLQSARWAFRCLEVGVSARVDAIDLFNIWRSNERKTELARNHLKCVRSDRKRVNYKVTCVKMAHAFAIRAFAVFLIAMATRFAWQPATDLLALLDQPTSKTAATSPAKT